VAGLVVVLLATGTYWLWQTNLADSDGDGLSNKVEASGWVTQDGTVYRTDPYKADTDGDGLTDADEAGALTTTAETGDVYAGFSHPLLSDTDDDDLGDADEADLGLDPRDRDTDDDELGDGYEVDVVGSDPETADTDSDGFADGYEDANREAQGLDPLWPDEQISTATYLTDFARGAAAGDLSPGDSLAWLAGNLAVSSAPVVGTLSDLRDAVGAAMHGDWVGASFSALSAVPLVEGVAIPGKAVAFIERNPKLAASAVRMIAKVDKIPDAIKLRVARMIYPRWDELVASGADEAELLRLLKGRTNLDDLGKALTRSSHVAGVAFPPVSTRERGKALLRDLLRAKAKAAATAAAKGAATAIADEVLTQVRMSLEGCGTDCDGVVRVFDLVASGVGHETKVGYVPWTRSVEGQIRKDAWLVVTGAIGGAHWHFLASSYSNTVGADPRVLDALDSAGISYTIHLPAGT
jgi:hypothetical protein